MMTAASPNNSSYKADNITVLEGLEAVRVRPAMYIGDTGKKGLHHLVWEIVDNGVDEALAGYCDSVKVLLEKDGFVRITDNGRGIPVDIHPKMGVPACEVVMTTLHAGGKFDKNSYMFSGGLHGVGASVVNALSEKLEMRIARDGYVWAQDFARGKKTTDLEQKSKSSKRGTAIRFKPDGTIFSTVEFDYSVIARRLRDTAFLTGIRFILRDERGDEPKEETFFSPGGVKDFVGALVQGSKAILPDPFFMSETRDGTGIEISLTYTEDYAERIFSFVNLINTPDGGTHVTGLRSGLTRAVNDCARRSGILKTRDENLTGEDLREGLVAVVSVKVSNPQFEGQTKGRLNNGEVSGSIAAALYEKLSFYFDANQSALKNVIDRAIRTKRERQAAKKARELVRNGSAKKSFSILSGKLADCQSKDVERRELFFVEGDSAGGSAKQGRNREFQAILPLRGKVLNCEKAQMVKILANAEIRTIIQVLGCGFGDDFDIKGLRYGKLFLMSDADVDGLHIRTLLLTFFYRMMPELIAEGRVFITQPPLYRVLWEGKNRGEKYLQSDGELDAFLKEHKKQPMTIQRFKGLGEMDPEQLWKTTMDPATRMVKRVLVSDAVEADRVVSDLMGSATDTRKSMLMSEWAG